MFEVLGLGAEFTFDARGTERISDIVGNLQTLSSQMNLSAEDTMQYSETLTDFGNVIGDMGKQLMLMGGLTTGTALYGIGKAAAWETEMINASRYMTDTSAEAQTKYNLALKETAQLLGTTKEEMNAATTSYMMMGKSTDEALRLAKNAGYAATTWDMTADSVADSFRSIKAAFQINLEDQDMYQKYLDTINEVGNSTAATSKDVINFLADGGAALHNVAGVSIEEAMGMASAARYANMSIAEFSTMLTRLGNQYAQEKSIKHFKKLGVEVKDANGKMRSFAQVLGDVQAKWTKLDDASKSSFVSSVGGVYADRLALYMGSGEEFKKGEKIAKQDNTGSAEAEFGRVTNTFNLAIARFKVTLSDFGQAFWGTLLPPMTKFVNVINSIVTKISNFMQAHPVIMKIISSFILLTGVALTLSGAFLVIGGLLSKLAAGLVLNHTMGLRAINIFRGLGVVFKNLRSNIAQTITKFGGMAAAIGLVYIAWKYDFFNMRSMFEGFITKMKGSLDVTSKLLKNDLSVKDFKEQVNSLNGSESIFDKLALGLTKVGLVFKGIGEYMSTGALSPEMFEKLNSMGLMPLISVAIGLGQRFKALWNGIKDGFIGVVDTVNTWIKDHLGPPLQWLHDTILLPVAKAFFGIDDSVTKLSETTGGMQFVNLDSMFGKVEDWEHFGKIIGGIAASFMLLSTIAKTLQGLGTIVKGVMAIGSGIGTVIGWIGGVFSAIGSAIGAVGGFISWLGNGIVWLIGGIGTVVTAILGFFGIIVTAPAWVVGAITVAVVAVIALIINFREEIWNFLTVTLPEAIGVAIDWLGNFFTVTLPEFIGTAIDAIGTFFTETLPSAIGYAIGWLVGTVFLFFTETFPSWFDMAVEAIANAIESIANFFFVTIPEAVGNAIESIANFLTDTLPSAIGSAFDAIGEFVSGIPEFLASLPDMLFDIGVNIIQGIIDGIESMVDAVFTAIGNFIDGFVNGFKDALGIHSPSTVFSDIGINLIEGLTNGIGGMIGAVGDAIGSVVGTIKDTVGGFIDGAVELGGDIVHGIGDGVNGAVGWIGDRANDVGTFFKNGWDTITNNASEWGSGVVNNLSKGISAVGNTVGTAVTNIVDGARTTITNLKDKALELGSDMMSRYEQGIESGQNPIQSAISAVAGTVSNTMQSIDKDALNWGANMISGFTDGIKSMADGAAKAASGVIGKIKNFLGFNSPAKMGEGRHIVEWGYNMISGFADGIDNANGLLQDTIADVITNPIDDILKRNASLPLSTTLDSNVNQTFNASSNLTGYLGQIITLLGMIAQATISIIPNQVESNARITDTSDTIQERIDRVNRLTTENNTRSFNVNISSGAIVNNFNIDGNGTPTETQEKLMQLISEVMDANLLPLLTQKINDLKVVLNE